MGNLIVDAALKQVNDDVGKVQDYYYKRIDPKHLLMKRALASVKALESALKAM
jgi:hypothetical protein